MLNETWMINKIENFSKVSVTTCDLDRTAETLQKITLEKLILLFFSTNQYEIRLLIPCIKNSFQTMLQDFQMNCIQINAHFNYLKIPHLLKFSISLVIKNIERFLECPQVCHQNQEFADLCRAVSVYLKSIRKLERIAMIYIDQASIQKFIGKHLLNKTFCGVLSKFLEFSFKKSLCYLKNYNNLTDFSCFLKVLKETLIRRQYFADSYHLSSMAIEFCETFLLCLVKHSKYLNEYNHPDFVRNFDSNHLKLKNAKKSVFVAKMFCELEKHNVVDLRLKKCYEKMKVS